VQSLPPTEPVIIPRSITLPLLHISEKLDIPPVLTYSDTVLYNWAFKTIPESREAVPELDNIRSSTLFTRFVDEEEFYLCSARIELRAVEILETMRVTMDETFLGDATAVRRITEHLNTIASALRELKSLLLNIKKLCDPEIYYNEVRPWFRGEDSSDTKSKWIFEGVNEEPGLRPPTELSGPSAGQSSVMHALDIFMGVDHQALSPRQPSLMSRMQTYMPKNHRLFLDRLKINPRPLRTFVVDKKDEGLMKAFNLAVIALKEFRDAHMIIASLYILGPARKAARRKLEVSDTGFKARPRSQAMKGTGGTDMVKFLKDTRDQTKEAIIVG
jgi:indoleamine 2,3-dioxygenase